MKLEYKFQVVETKSTKMYRLAKFDWKTYANLYETQKWYVKWVISLGCVEYEPTAEFQEYRESRLEYDALECNENSKRNHKRRGKCSAK